MAEVIKGRFGVSRRKSPRRLGWARYEVAEAPVKDKPDIERPGEEERPNFEKDAPQERDHPDMPPLIDEDEEDVRRRDLPVA